MPAPLWMRGAAPVRLPEFPPPMDSGPCWLCCLDIIVGWTPHRRRFSISNKIARCFRNLRPGLGRVFGWPEHLRNPAAASVSEQPVPRKLRLSMRLATFVSIVIAGSLAVSAPLVHAQTNASCTFHVFQIPVSGGVALPQGINRFGNIVGFVNLFTSGRLHTFFKWFHQHF